MQKRVRSEARSPRADALAGIAANSRHLYDGHRRAMGSDGPDAALALELGKRYAKVHAEAQ